MINIEERNIFENALKDGISLFLGAGFSVLSKDELGNSLPCGSSLLDEIKSEFPTISEFSDLSKACTVLEKSVNREKFREYLIKRFTVHSFTEEYDNLTNINIKNIFTTNIDNLIFKIWEKSNNTKKYINNALNTGEVENKLAINYYPIHGCILNDKEFIFSNIQIASAFSNQKGSWESLKVTVNNSPILFWGWNFNDSDIIEAMYSNKNRLLDENEKKWILLRNPSKSEIDFYKSLNFSIITGDTKDLLEYFGEIIDDTTPKYKNNLLSDIPYVIPKITNITSYPVEEFFKGDFPRWSYIFSGQIHKTNHYKKILNLIYSKSDIIITGIPASGKTTLLMQLAYGIDIVNKHILFHPTLDEVKNYCKIIGNTKTIVFVDDCLNDYIALIELMQRKNIQVIGFERDSKYESISYRLSENNINFELYDVSEITENDIVPIIDSIPRKLYNGKMENIRDKTIFEIITKHIKRSYIIKNRISDFLNNLYSTDKEAAELFLLISYVHSCGVPVSYDMIYSYLNKNNYKEVYDDIKRIGKLIKSCDPEFDFFENIDFRTQDYYMCRTRYIAEIIINNVQNLELMRTMLTKFIENVPKFKICRYDIFKSSAFNADLITKYFTEYSEGIEFYEKCLDIDNSGFMYQQISLYASRKRNNTDAFRFIDKAMNCEKKNIFSIRNTHAIILFNANICNDSSDENVIKTLHKSLEILSDCYKNDLRKGFHALIFGEFILKLHEVYGYREVNNYLDTALEWLNKESSNNENSNKSRKKMKNIISKIEDNIIKKNKIID